MLNVVAGPRKPTTNYPIDWVDIVSGPAFIATMMWEARALRDVPQREFGDLDQAPLAELADPSEPADPLVPVGFERRDTAASLTMLVGNVAVNLAMAGVLGRVHGWLYRHRLFTFKHKATSMAAAMVAWDFFYYWSHRWQHERRILWANHVTHHSSERYNLSTALRQPWSSYLTSWVFFPISLLGISYERHAKASQLNLLYQYWIHTEAIDRLPGNVERWFNTPSHHRVHHGANPQYLDRNYAGILIVWDKMFGTFEPEHRRVKYGLTKNIDTFNPVVIGYHEMFDIARDVQRRPGWRDKLRSVFGRTGWEP